MTRYVYYGPDENPHQELVFSDDDLLWLGRAFVGEHGDGKEDWKFCGYFVWAMINRYLLHRGNQHWPSFKYMLRAFSQPINPRWMKGGKFVKKYPNSKMCTPQRLKQREGYCRLQWLNIPYEVRVILECFQRYSPPILDIPLKMNRISNFIASTPRRRKKWHWGFDLDGNWYLEDRRLRQGVVAIDLWSGK